MYGIKLGEEKMKNRLLKEKIWKDYYVYKGHLMSLYSENDALKNELHQLKNNNLQFLSQYEVKLQAMHHQLRSIPIYFPNEEYSKKNYNFRSGFDDLIKEIENIKTKYNQIIQSQQYQ